MEGVKSSIFGGKSVILWILPCIMQDFAEKNLAKMKGVKSFSFWRKIRGSLYFAKHDFAEFYLVKSKGVKSKYAGYWSLFLQCKCTH